MPKFQACTLSVVDGLRINCESNEFPGQIEKAITPLLSKYWLVCPQAGPFSITDKANYEELSAEIDSLIVDVPGLKDTNVHLMRPGVFHRLAPLFVVDEWTYLFALEGPEEFAIENALKIDETEWLSSKFFEVVEASTRGFFLYVLGFWEIYLPGKLAQADPLMRDATATVDAKHWVDDGVVLE